MQVRLVTGEQLVLRRPPATDLGNAMEVFLFATYEPPKPLGDLKHIVDLGANVGYSVTYFAHRYREARIEAWEPVPTHVTQLATNLKANCLQDRVSVHPYAAGPTTGTKWFLDAGTQSRAIEGSGQNAVRVEMVDWLAHARGTRIDFLKMDIEGGEYDLLFDPRFEALRIPCMVVEWHCTPSRPHGDEEIKRRLHDLGYELFSGRTAEVDDMRAGMIWAYR